MVLKSKVTRGSELVEKSISENTAQSHSGGNQLGDQEHNTASHLKDQCVYPVRSQWSFNNLSQPSDWSSDQCWVLVCIRIRILLLIIMGNSVRYGAPFDQLKMDKNVDGLQV